VSESQYFIRRLRPHERPAARERLEIQVLDDDGLAVAVAYATEASSILSVEGHEIPSAVIEAAKRCEEGGGKYVDAQGSTVQPF
jgi:hypothetical protein